VLQENLPAKLQWQLLAEEEILADLDASPTFRRARPEVEQIFGRGASTEYVVAV
jgi:hypothetical protein